MAYKWVATLTPWLCNINVGTFHGLQVGDNTDTVTV